ncbi:hypothetical protein [Belnapia sp. F-4-1]|uniref:hypothetical protein n=1 Tax=Belnapia sp. F-4-1 TaxID=1545443 RepID=UPI0005B9B415|nr:hypothetical protein [Belnapia sp. F-4-1]
MKTLEASDPFSTPKRLSVPPVSTMQSVLPARLRKAWFRRADRRRKDDELQRVSQRHGLQIGDLEEVSLEDAVHRHRAAWRRGGLGLQKQFEIRDFHDCLPVRHAGSGLLDVWAVYFLPAGSEGQ